MARLVRGSALSAGLAIGLLTLAVGSQVRAAEASVLRWLLSTPWSSATRDKTTVYLDLGRQHAVGLNVSAECTVGILVLPLLIAYCAFVTFSGVRVRSALIGLTVGCAVVAVANELRLVSILVAWQRWGGSGLWVAHVLIGSMVSLFAVLAALALQLRLSLRDGLVAHRSF